ncbi:MAG: hypothetical protein M5R40_28235 [Anaerolineae bacterium]|nr:hypothetical protein [Anaerolineae bacterium]
MGDTVFLSILTGGEAQHLALPSCAEAVVTVIFHGRDHRWFDLLAFSVLPDEVQLVVTPRMQKPDSIVRNLQGQTTPPHRGPRPHEGRHLGAALPAKKTSTAPKRCRRRSKTCTARPSSWASANTPAITPSARPARAIACPSTPCVSSGASAALARIDCASPFTCL